ncbi:uncharacterized protein LOC122378040 [Amphibalanus amphitrite]|uniref:uncharacterized protein LOC122378040 n=1 Tax=Amphibalanus amphitrite TaxID=1232801 RepID=UPI001C8FD70E|nr:uncharacterized protein LOC122378040 [Amphibalanus amphitrite]
MRQQADFLECQLLKDKLAEVPVEPVSYQAAKASRHILMTAALVTCVGRPSHVTGLTVPYLKAAKAAIINGKKSRLIRNTDYTTADSTILDVTVPEAMWNG